MTNEELVIMIQNGISKQDCLEQLYCQNYGMIVKICNKYKGVEDLEDLLQESFFGLQKAVDMWEPDGGATFIGYAIFWIRQSILRYIDNFGSCIRVPVSRRSQIGQYNKVLNQYRMTFGHNPSDRELCALLDLSRQQLKDLKADIHALRIRSTAEFIGGEDDDLTLEDSIADERDDISNLIDRIQNEELSAALWSEVDALAPKEAAVLRDRYQNGHTLKECSEALGCSQQYAKALHDKALRSLRRGNHLKRLKPFITESGARSLGLKGGSLSSFHASWTSSQERAVMMLEQRTGLSLWHGKEIEIETSEQ